MTWRILRLIGLCLTAAPLHAEESERSVQLYLYFSPSPKWGYVAENSDSGNEVQFYDCNAPHPVLVNRSKLKEADGLCPKHANAPDGTWVVKYDAQKKEFELLDADSEKSVYFTKEELFGQVHTFPEFTQQPFGVAIEGRSKKVFRLGKTQ
jgi:hypothetical protein